MNLIHQDDYNAIGNQHEQVTGRINDMLIELQNHSYATGVDRGKELAKRAAIEAGTISPARRQTIHLGQPGVTVEPCLMLGPADDEVACLLFTAPGIEVRLTWPTQTQALAVLAAATGEQVETQPSPAAAQRNQCDGCQAGIPVEDGMHRMGKPGGYVDLMACTADRYGSAPVERCDTCYGHGEVPTGKTQRFGDLQPPEPIMMACPECDGQAPVERVEQEVVAAWRGINDVGEVVTEWIDGAPPECMTDLCVNDATYAQIELAYATPQPAPTAAQDVAGLVDALSRLERACDRRAALLTSEVYRMCSLIPGMDDALLELQDARKQARGLLDAHQNGGPES